MEIDEKIQGKIEIMNSENNIMKPRIKRTDSMPVEEEMDEIPPNSKRKRTEEMIKKDSSFQVCSKSAEKVMLATEQNLENYMMLLEILLRLPVKSLLRFMWACKHWKKLILSDSFRKLHREKHISSPPLPIACYNSENYVTKPINLLKNNQRNPDPTYNYLITFDLDGKILGKITLPFPSDIFSYTRLPYQSKLMLFVGGDELISFYLYNPSTRQTTLLTDHPCLSSPEVDHRASDLGYIPSKDEYIIVHLVKLSSGILACEVLNFSISNDNFRLHYKPWRSINATTKLSSFIVKLHSGVFVGGAFYWEASSDKKLDCSIILSFDVETESFSTFGKPGDLLSNNNSLLQLKDELYLANYPTSPPTLVLWKFSSDNKLWTRHWEFDLERLFGLAGGALNEENYFNWTIFIYTLKYIKGYEHQPCDEDLSDDMGLLLLDDGRYEMPLWQVEAHTNLFTL